MGEGILICHSTVTYLPLKAAQIQLWPAADMQLMEMALLFPDR